MEKKQLIFAMFLIIFLLPFISAEILINDVKPLYNLGDLLDIQVTIKASQMTSGFLKLNLLCNGVEREFYKEYIFLTSGEEKKLSPTLLLISEFTNGLSSQCKIKAELRDESLLTDEFTVSNLMSLEIKSEEVTLKPGEMLSVEGQATLENNRIVNGVVEASLPSIDKTYYSTINEGYLLLEIQLPEEIPSGMQTLNINTYERDVEGNKTNKGFTSYNFNIEQIPKNLEIYFETKEVEPGTNLMVKAILHDQTGEIIPSTAIITIKGKNNKIIHQDEKPIDEFLEYPIAYDQEPIEWKVYAVSNKVSNEETLKIIEKQAIDVVLVNKTLTIKNTGNVVYNKTVSVQISDKAIEIPLNLKVGKEETYLLSAPDGEYEIKINSEGNDEISKNTLLTGKAIDVKKTGNFSVIITHPLSWIFIIVIFGFVAFIVFKKGYKKSFFGKMPAFTKKLFKKAKTEKNIQLAKTKNNAELSLSIRGAKQDASMICLKIKNFEELQENYKKVEEVFKKIVELIEEQKSFIYQNKDYLFFILAPIHTRTFKNQKSALDLSRKIQKMLDAHNKLAQQKINYGIALNHGSIVAKKEKEFLKFMSMGRLIGDAKKTATISEEDILLTSEMNSNLRSHTKTEKIKRNSVEAFTIKEIKHKSEENKSFIKNFIRRLEGENKK